MSTPVPIPIVLSISGHDPGGGAGIQADIESITANGCHACSVITCLTEQDTCDVCRMSPQPPSQVLAQARTLMADSQIAAVKIGLLGEAGIARALGQLLEEHPGIPVVLDPVLASGAGTDLTGQALERTIREWLLPRAALATPNSLEARALVPDCTSLDDCGAQWLGLGCAAVLITGTHESGPQVINRLYRRDHPPVDSAWPRLPESYHGSGCTLASAIAARLARGEELTVATRKAQEYTWQTLYHGLRTGRCQPIPNRLFGLGRGVPS